MLKKKDIHMANGDLLKEIEDLRAQLIEANDTIEAIRTGQIDALVVEGDTGHELYTLRSADHTYRIFIEKMAEGAVTVSQHGLIFYCNTQFANLVQCSLSDVIGRPFDIFVSDDGKDMYAQLFEQCWNSDCKAELMLIAGQQRIPVQISLALLQLDEGASISIIVTDLTNQKKTQQQLLENNLKLENINHALEISNDDLQQFASVASHDLQEPLRKIQMFADLMTEKKDSMSRENDRYLQKIIDSAARMKVLIMDILKYSRLSATGDHLDRIDLNEVVNEFKEDFELLIADRSARLIIDELPVMYGNKGQIRQVFQNIISNAIKFAKPNVPPIIQIKSNHLLEKSFNSPPASDGPYFLLSIRDNGIGFDEKYIHNIFSLFERLHTKDEYEGSGIGLSIAKKIVEKHNGLITAISKEGAGAEFRIILPTNAGRQTP